MSPPISCTKLIISPRNNTDKKIVETGPRLPIIETVLAPMIDIPAEIKKLGITVQNMAIIKAYP